MLDNLVHRIRLFFVFMHKNLKQLFARKILINPLLVDRSEDHSFPRRAFMSVDFKDRKNVNLGIRLENLWSPKSDCQKLTKKLLRSGMNMEQSRHYLDVAVVVFSKDKLV